MADQAVAEREYTTKVDYPAIYWSNSAPKEIAFAAALRGYDCADIQSPFVYCDLACGPGETVSLLAKCYPHAQFYAVDINQSHVERAKSRAEALGLTNLTVLQGDLRDLDALNLPKSDFVTLMGVLSWIPLKLQRQAIKNAAKLLNENGLLVTHYTAAPIAGLDRCTASVLAMLTPVDLEGTKEGAKAAFERFNKLSNAKVGIYPQLAGQCQAIEAHFKRDPDYAVHDFFHSATTLNFEDFSDMVEENRLEYVASANLAQMLPDGFVSERLIKQFDFETDWRRHQPLLQTLTREAVRVDIYGQANNLRNVSETFRSGTISKLRVNTFADDWRTALQTKNAKAPVDLLAKEYVDVIERLDGRSAQIGSLFENRPDTHNSDIQIVRRLAHLVAYGILNVSLKEALDESGVEDLTLETFSYADDLWRYLAVNRALPLPSAVNGTCITFNNDAKMKLYLMLGGDPDRLLNRLKRMPGFSDLRTANGIIRTGDQLKQVVAPVLPEFSRTWQIMLKRLGIA